MAWVVTAIAGGALLGGGLSAMSNQGVSVDESYNAQVQSGMNSDAEINDWAKGMYQYNDITPYQEAPVSVYSSPTSTGQGYYYNHKRKMAIPESEYIRVSGNGRENLEGRWFVKDENGNEVDEWEWIPVGLKDEVDPENSQSALEGKQSAAANELFPKISEYAGLQLDSATKRLPFQEGAEIATNKNIIDTMPSTTEAQIAANQYSIDTLPEKTKADIATYGYTQAVMPEKTVTDIAAMQEQQMKISSRAPIYSKYYSQALNGVDVRGQMDAAGQETAHQFAIGKDVALQEMKALGVDPSSASGMRALGNLPLDRAKAIATAKMQAKSTAEDTNFSRLQSALTI